LGFVKENSVVEELILSDQKLTSKEIPDLVAALKTHPSVVRIDLSRNPIGYEGAKFLLTLVTVNPHITTLRLEDTSIHPRKIATIEEQLARNRARLKSSPSSAAQ